METLKKLAEKIIDRKIIGNQDQLVMDWVRDKYKNTIPNEEIFERGLTAIRNFDATKQKVLRERHRRTLTQTEY